MFAYTHTCTRIWVRWIEARKPITAIIALNTKGIEVGLFAVRRRALNSNRSYFIVCICGADFWLVCLTT